MSVWDPGLPDDFWIQIRIQTAALIYLQSRVSPRVSSALKGVQGGHVRDHGGAWGIMGDAGWASVGSDWDLNLAWLSGVQVRVEGL